MNKNNTNSAITPSEQNLAATLLSVFPPFLVALIFFPTLVGLAINSQLVDWSEPLIILAITTLLILARNLTSKNIFYYLAAIFIFSNSFAMLVHWIMLRGPMSATSLFVVFNTNYEEAVGFFHLKNNLEFLLLIPYIIIFIFSLLFSFKPKHRPNKSTYLIFGVVTIIVIAFFGMRINRGGFRDGTPLLVKSSTLFYKEVSAFKKLKSDNKKRMEAVDAKADHLEVPQVFVLIKGESTNRNHMSLYGYSRQTSPLLTEFENLIAYDDVVSAYTMTLESISAAMSEANLENNRKTYESFDLMEIFRAADVKTYWLSNQSPLGIWDNLVTLLAQQADVTDFVNVTSDSSLDSFSKTSYDSKLFPSLHAALKDKSQRKFIVVHLMGSHATYSKRYPPEFDVYKGDTHKDEIIAAYDNSILYNDFVVDSLLKIIRNYSEETNAVSAAIYVADHGENVYDDADYAGHDYTISVPKSIVEVPFLVWLSPEYEQTYPEKAEVIKQHQHDPFVTDDLFHSILDISHITTSVLENQRSVFHPEYNNSRKRVLSDGFDYDEK